MSNNMTTTRQRYAVLPSIVLVVSAMAFLLVSGARAEDPPIVSVGPVTAAGNTGSAGVGQNGKADACVNDEASQADPSAGGTGGVKVNEGSCAGGTTSGGTGTGGAGSGSSQSGGGSSSAGSTGAGSTGAGRSSSTGSTATATRWVSAGGAVGLRIVRVRHLTKGVSFTKRFRVLVTVKDMRGKLVRNAIIGVGGVPGSQSTITARHWSFSNRVGQATVRVAVSRPMLGKRLFLKISARTPKARTVVLRSVRLPALAT